MNPKTKKERYESPEVLDIKPIAVCEGDGESPDSPNEDNIANI